MKQVFLLLFSVSVLFKTSAQDRIIDSLKAELIKETDLTKKFDLHKKLRRTYSLMGRVDSAENYLAELYKITAELKNDSLLLISYYETSILLDYKSDSKEQINFLLKALKIAEEKYPSQIHKIYTGLGICL